MRRRRLAVSVAAALAAVAAAFAFLIAFDEAWLRPLVQRYVRAHADRPIDFRRIAFRLDDGGRPLVRVHDLVIGNAPWAAPEPLIRATELEAVFDPRSFFVGPRIVIERLRLVDATLDLERQADGLRNWRIADPNDRGPGRIRVQELDAERTRIRVVQGALGLETVLRFGARRDMPAGTAPRRPLEAIGTRDGAAFAATLETGTVLTFYDTGRAVPFSGRLTTAGASVRLDGMLGDLAQLGTVDAAIAFDARAGDGLATLATVFAGRAASPAWLPGLAASGAAARVTKAGRAWLARDARLQLGRSDLAGELRLQAADPADPASAPAAWQATLTSRRVDAAELRAAIPPAAGPPASQARAGARASVRARPDVEATWAAERIDGVPRAGPIEHVTLKLGAHAGVWTADTIGLTVADGRVTGTARLDTAAAPDAASVRLDVDGVRLDRFGVRDVAGRVVGRLVLETQGDAADALIAGARGELTGRLADASLAPGLDAKLGLDAGAWLRSLVADGGRAAVRCSAFDLRIDGGLGTVRTLALETDGVLLAGSGRIDLLHRRVDLTLTPHRKTSALLALDRSVAVTGPFAAPSIHLVARRDVAAPAGCGGGAIRPAR